MSLFHPRSLCGVCRRPRKKPIHLNMKPDEVFRKRASTLVCPRCDAPDPDLTLETLGMNDPVDGGRL